MDCRLKTVGVFREKIVDRPGADHEFLSRGVCSVTLSLPVALQGIDLLFERFNVVVYLVFQARSVDRAVVEGLIDRLVKPFCVLSQLFDEARGAFLRPGCARQEQRDKCRSEDKFCELSHMISFGSIDSGSSHASTATQ